MLDCVSWGTSKGKGIMGINWHQNKQTNKRTNTPDRLECWTFRKCQVFCKSVRTDGKVCYHLTMTITPYEVIPQHSMVTMGKLPK